MYFCGVDSLWGMFFNLENIGEEGMEMSREFSRSVRHVTVDGLGPRTYMKLNYYFSALETMTVKREPIYDEADGSVDVDREEAASMREEWREIAGEEGKVPEIYLLEDLICPDIRSMICPLGKL
jgi:hypothetical protein